jgi:hypothetical protein
MNASANGGECSNTVADQRAVEPFRSVHVPESSSSKVLSRERPGEQVGALVRPDLMTSTVLACSTAKDTSAASIQQARSNVRGAARMSDVVAAPRAMIRPRARSQFTDDERVGERG